MSKDDPSASSGAVAAFQRALALHRAGRFAEAEPLYRAVLAEAPRHFDALHLWGVIRHQTGDHLGALQLIDHAIAINPSVAFAHSNRGLALQELRRFDEALAAFDRAVALKPDLAEAYYNRANVLRELIRPGEALAAYNKALQFKPEYLEALINRGTALSELGRSAEALASFERAVALAPNSVDALYNCGTMLLGFRRPAEALSYFDRTLSLAPGHTDAHMNRGNALRDMKRPEEALVSHDRALALKPDFAAALNNRGNALLELRRFDEAFTSYNRALTLKPDYAEAYCNRGNAFLEIRKYTDALADFDRALNVKPDFAEALNNRCNALFDLKRYGECAAAAARLLAAHPEFDYALGVLFQAQRHGCDWTGFEETRARIASDVGHGRRSDLPFPFLTHSTNAQAQLDCARIYAQDKYPAAATPLWSGERYRHDRIRLAYLSADFQNHATANLMAELFESHDAERFDVWALSFGPSDDSEMRRRLEHAIPHFIDVQDFSDQAAARLMREQEIDIAVDLKGFTTSCRPGIFAHRPCPVQVSYLGFPATMGVDYIDYIVADRRVIPPGFDAFYSEKVVRLPDSYQPNDRQRRIASNVPVRNELGLPEHGFVFCCFNSSYKITPPVFDIWMRLLKKLDGSVLWLLDEGEPTPNLKREAEARGVSSSRLVFAPLVGLADHLARESRANLFLDTFPCNAHTTASDALWAGVPLVTCVGETFASRVAASLLHAIGLPELITDDLAAYEVLALKLATTPALLGSIRTRLASNRDTQALFDSARFRRHLEAAYRTMQERQQRGEPPRAFDVPQIGV